MPTFAEILIKILALPLIVPPLVGILVGVVSFYIKQYFLRKGTWV
jgi:hypothetical protein